MTKTAAGVQPPHLAVWLWVVMPRDCVRPWCAVCTSVSVCASLYPQPTKSSQYRDRFKDVCDVSNGTRRFWVFENCSYQCCLRYILDIVRCFIYRICEPLLLRPPYERYYGAQLEYKLTLCGFFALVWPSGTRKHLGCYLYHFETLLLSAGLPRIQRHIQACATRMSYEGVDTVQLHHQASAKHVISRRASASLRPSCCERAVMFSSIVESKCTGSSLDSSRRDADHIPSHVPSHFPSHFPNRLPSHLPSHLLSHLLSHLIYW